MNRYTPANVARYLREHLLGKANRFLHHVSGVIHVGANSGQERDHYAKYGLNVLWIEPIPEVFTQLEDNIASYPDQRALQALVTDRDGQSVEFHVANNDGESSSLFDFHQHKEMWPEVDYQQTLQLKSITLTTLINRRSIDLKAYGALVMDTQGSELLVLKGAESILTQFSFIKSEAADFESYKGGCQLKEIEDFLREHGFAEFCREQTEAPNTKSCSGNYYEVVYRRIR